MRKLVWTVALSCGLLGVFVAGYLVGSSVAPPPGVDCGSPTTVRLQVVPRSAPCPDDSCQHVERILFPTYEEPVYIVPAHPRRAEIGL